MRSARLLASILCLTVGARATAEEPPKLPKDLVGAWAFAEDRSDPKPPANVRPNMGPRFVVAEDGAALTVTWTRGGAQVLDRYALDGTVTTATTERTVTRHRARWEAGRLLVDTTLESSGLGGTKETTVTSRAFTPTDEGLLVTRAITAPIRLTTTCLYKRAPEGGGAAPTPAPATIGALAWLAGAWAGTMGTASIEERWSPPLGGAMLATSRTVVGGRMVAFEFLRVVERGGGLAYVAQPNGSPPTEFVCTSVGASKAVFENPAHDFPQRITYELGADGALTAEIADAAGGRAQRFRFAREVAR